MYIPCPSIFATEGSSEQTKGKELMPLKSLWDNRTAIEDCHHSDLEPGIV